MAAKLRKQRTTYLPEPLTELVESLNLTRIQQDKTYRLIDTIAKRSRQKTGLDTSYFDLPRDYLVSVFTLKYMKVLQPLLELGIVERNNIYYKNQCYKYRVNPKFYKTEKAYKKVVYRFKMPRELLATIKGDDRRVNLYSFHRDHVSTCKKLDINFVKLHSETAKAIDEEKRNPTQKRNGKYKSLQQMEAHYKKSIDNLGNEKSIYASRNTTNGRLDSNFSNMPSRLFDVIIQDNDWTTIDLVNSQFAILNRIMRTNGAKGEGINEFSNLIENGKLYDYIARRLNISRNEAKKIMFEINFGRHYFQTMNKKLFSQLFPEVDEWIKARKEKHGYQEVALMLQRFESRIFIDGIKTELCQKGIMNITKHDSVSCDKNNVQEVKSIMLKHLNQYRIKGYLRDEQTNEYIQIAI